LHDCSPCSWLDGVSRHLSTYSCRSLEYSDYSPPRIHGGYDDLRTTDIEEATYSGPKCVRSAGNCSTDKGMVRSDMSKPALIFFSLQEYTQQNTLSKF
jgi:hypothetical protein